jgi:hypothetical protein
VAALYFTDHKWSCFFLKFSKALGAFHRNSGIILLFLSTVDGFLFLCGLDWWRWRRCVFTDYILRSLDEWWRGGKKGE